eukprot:9388083-Ditylum_brightwellii.AAC.1
MMMGSKRKEGGTGKVQDSISSFFQHGLSKENPNRKKMYLGNSKSSTSTSSTSVSSASSSTASTPEKAISSHVLSVK